MGYEKGRAILANIGREILESKTQLMLEAKREGAILTPIQTKIKSLHMERDRLDARYATERFEEMVRMDDVDVEELKQENLEVLRALQLKNLPSALP